MSLQSESGDTRSQHLTRETLFISKASRIYLFDSIHHGTARYILSAATSDLQWSEYFGLSVMTVGGAAKYYGVRNKDIKRVLDASSHCLGEMIESGLLILRDGALDDIRSQFYIDPKVKEFLLFPPQSILRLCLFLPALPAVFRTFNALWDYAVSKGMDESTLPDWKAVVDRHFIIPCDRIGAELMLADRLKAEAKNLNLYPYIQHFGAQDCLESWFALLAYEGDFPPPRGNYFIRKYLWDDRIAQVALK